MLNKYYCFLYFQNIYYFLYKIILKKKLPNAVILIFTPDIISFITYFKYF